MTAMTCASALTSHSKPSASTPSSRRTRSAAASMRSLFWLAMTIFAPSAPRRRAAERPMPLDPPVTMATRFLKRMGSDLLLLFRELLHLAAAAMILARPVAATAGETLLILAWQDHGDVQAHALHRQNFAPGMNKLFVSLADPTDVAVQVVEAERVHSVVLLAQRGIPIDLVRQRVPG